MYLLTDFFRANFLRNFGNMAGHIEKGLAYRLPILSSWQEALERGTADEDQLHQNAQM
jgi:hypothetical protein